MAEHSGHSKPDIFNDKVYISKRSIRKTFVNKRWYMPAKCGTTVDPNSKEEGLKLHSADETLPSAGHASEMVLADRTAECATDDLGSCSGLGDQEARATGVKQNPIDRVTEEELADIFGIRIKVEEESLEPCDLFQLPRAQQDATAERDESTTAGQDGPNSPPKQASGPRFVFAALKKRGVEGDTENRPYKCTHCNWAFKKPSNLLSHMDTHRGLKPYVCELCGKAYSHQGTLQQHKRLHTGERPYQCPFCDKTCIWSSDYRKHIRTHTGEKPYVCKQCGKEFVRSSDLRKHERNLHANDKPFPCNECGKTFNKPLSLLRHERTHLGERPFLCPECGKAFAVASRLAEHRKAHSGVRPYVCPICSKAFTKSSNLAEHMSVHTGLRPHRCSDCGAAFAMPSRLLRHQRVHAGVRPYCCQGCGRSFSRAAALQRHLLQRQCEGRIFICPRCSKSFPCDVQLADHMLCHAAEEVSAV